MASPSFAYREIYLDALSEIFKRIILPGDTRRILSACILAENSVVELTGTYGVAKSTFVFSVMKTLFSDIWEMPVKPIAKLRETLTEFDVFWYVDIAAMQRGDEEREVRPRPIVTAPFKFINEIRRGSPKVYQTLLSLLAEGELEYKGRVYKSSSYVCFLDSNPKDTASVEVPKALIDRIDARVFFNALGVTGVYTMLRQKFDGGSIEYADIVGSLTPAMDSKEIASVWRDVAQVKVPGHVLMFLSLLYGAMQCVREYESQSMGPGAVKVAIDRTVTEPYFMLQCDKCQYNGGLCSRLDDVWGVRWLNSSVKMAKALAWVDGSHSVSLGHVLFAIPYTLNHRLVLKNPSSYPNSFTFIRLYLPSMIRTVGRTWSEVGRLWARYVRGDTEALSMLRSLSQRDSAVKKLVEELERRGVQGPLQQFLSGQ
jgi:hypothetical protein